MRIVIAVLVMCICNMSMASGETCVYEYCPVCLKYTEWIDICSGMPVHECGLECEESRKDQIGYSQEHRYKRMVGTHLVNGECCAYHFERYYNALKCAKCNNVKVLNNTHFEWAYHGTCGRIVWCPYQSLNNKLADCTVFCPVLRRCMYKA